ncbi:MAG: NDP-sugar synthase [Blastocatellales bacterium]|nr:NDP-sugar synthase [Blastocatellales bacterium]
MRAIVIATDSRHQSSLLSDRLPGVLVPLVDRPFLQHVVEYLIDRGVAEIDFVLSHLPQRIEQALGDGTRWGSRFRYHLARDAAKPYKILKSLSRDSDPVLLVHADRLPQIDPKAHRPENQEQCPVIFNLDGSGKKWTGWAWLSHQQIAALPDDAEFEQIGNYLEALALESGTLVDAEALLDFETPEQMIESQGRVLQKQFDGLMVTGQEAEPGAWLSRNVSLHPTARLVAPVFIGENCRIGQGVQLGPNAVIGADCILEKHSVVSNSMILPGSYVGEGIELDEAIVDRNRLINVRVGIAVSVADNFILGSLSDEHIGNWANGLISKVLGLFLLVIAAPLILITAIWLKLARRGTLLHYTDAIKLPAQNEEHEWRTYRLLSFAPRTSETPNIGASPASGWRDVFLFLLPGLINVARGDLRMVGVAPRSRDEVLALSSDWRALYLSAKGGLITEACVLYGANPSEDELYSSEAVYAVNASMMHDLRLIGGYIRRLFTGR